MIIKLLAVILAVTTSGLSDDTPQTTEAKGSSEICVLPPYPKNGNYSLESSAITEDIKYHFSIKVTCDPGYQLIGQDVVFCVIGAMPVPMPECLPYCNADKESFVVTCDAKAPRCVLNPSIGLGLGSRRSLPTRDNGNLYVYLDVCGELGIATTNIIAGGHSADIHELPWHAGIYKKTTAPYMQICGGSLISTNVVISAAHCFWSDIEKLQPARNFAVAVGKLYRPWNNERDTYAQKSDVYEIKIPDRFRGSATNFQDDIAVVIVAKDFLYNDRVKPVCLSFDHQLDEKQLQDGSSGTVGGWGLTGEDSKPSQVLKAVSIPYVDIKKCISESPPSFTAYITSDKICAGYLNGTAVCKGDSGGGLVFGDHHDNKYRYFLRGIVSTAPNNDHLCNVFALGTFTHVTSHERFIRAAIRSDVTVPQVSTVSETSPGWIFQTANLMNIVTRKPTTQWI